MSSAIPQLGNGIVDEGPRSTPEATPRFYIESRRRYRILDKGAHAGWTCGPDGMSFSDFAQFGSADTSTRYANWHCERSELTEAGKSIIAFEKNPVRPKGTSGRRSRVCLSDIPVTLSVASERLMQENPECVLHVAKWRCDGGTHQGRATGANCQRVPQQPGWCNALGSCSSACTLKLPAGATPAERRTYARNLQLHSCAAGLTVKRTCASVADATVLFRFTGTHVPADVPWVPPRVLSFADSSRSVFEREGRQPVRVLPLVDEHAYSSPTPPASSSSEHR